jgi:hypothetical protein
VPTGGIPDEEPYRENYYKLIEQATDLEQYDSNEKLEELAEGFLGSWWGVEKVGAVPEVSERVVRINMGDEKHKFGAQLEALIKER